MNAVVTDDLPIFYVPDLRTDEHVEQLLPESEAAHAGRVLRLCVGSKVYVTDGIGAMYLAELAELNKRSVRFRLISKEYWQKYWRGRLTLAIAPTKSVERMEWMLEKAVEIGIDNIIFLSTKHSERKYINTDRLRRIMLSAVKQSQKALLPNLFTEVSLTDALVISKGSQLFVAHCRWDDSELTRRQTLEKHYEVGRDVTLFIGPEGDFTAEEVILLEEHGAYPTTLGDSRLRSETAAVVALQWIHTLQLIAQRRNNR